RGESQPGYEMQVEIGEGDDEEEAVGAVEDAAVAGKELAEVLDADLTFERRFKQVPDLTGRPCHHSDNEAMIEGKMNPEAEGGSDGHRPDQAGDRAFDGLARRERGSQFMPSDGLADEEGKAVGRPDTDGDKEHQPGAVVCFAKGQHDRPTWQAAQQDKTAEQ